MIVRLAPQVDDSLAWFASQRGLPYEAIEVPALPEAAEMVDQARERALAIASGGKRAIGDLAGRVRSRRGNDAGAAELGAGQVAEALSTETGTSDPVDPDGFARRFSKVRSAALSRIRRRADEDADPQITRRSRWKTADGNTGEAPRDRERQGGGRSTPAQALCALQNPKVRAELVKHGRAVMDATQQWIADRQKRGDLSGTDRLAERVGRFGQKGLERREPNLRAAVTALSVDSPTLTTSLRPMTESLDDVARLLTVAGALPFAKRKRAHMKIDDVLDELESGFFDAALEGARPTQARTEPRSPADFPI